MGEASGDHLHWHVAVIPPDTQPTYNGYYLEYVEDTGIQPEVIPIVCHAGGQSVLWRFGIYTAAGCPAAAKSPARTVFRTQPEPRTPLESALRKIASISDEGVWIALNNPRLLYETHVVMARMEPDFHDLMSLGRARISVAELNLVVGLFREYERLGGAEVTRVLAPIRRQLESPSGRQALGIVLDGPFPGLD